jgi:hypothetical protein
LQWVTARRPVVDQYDLLPHTLVSGTLADEFTGRQPAITVAAAKLAKACRVSR